jgi:hypothetical protein
LVFGSSWKKLIDFQLSHDYLYISNLWYQSNLPELIKTVKKHGDLAPESLSLNKCEFKFLFDLNEKEI